MNAEHRKYILENVGKRSVKQIAGDLRVNEKAVKRFLENEKDRPSPLAAPVVPAVKAFTAREKIFIKASIILIVILGAIVYANSLKGEFLYDDIMLVERNIYIKSWSGLSDIFTKDIGAGAGSDVHYYNFYRPLQMLTYMIDNSLWGLNPTGFHITSALLHIAMALALYWLISILFNDKILSFLASALFVVHPIHTEAVSYISGRADMLSGSLILLSLIFYVKNLRSENIMFLAASLAAYCMALLSKEYSIILPLLLLVYHFSFKQKIKLKTFAVILGISAVYIVLRSTVFNFVPSQAAESGPFIQRLPGFFVAIFNYLRLLMLPMGLHMEYGTGTFTFADPQAITGAVILLSMIAYLFMARERKGIAFFSVAWFLVAIFPVSNLYPINAYMAEHWLYVPSIGFFLMAAKVLSSGYRNKNLKAVIVVVSAALIASYSYATIKQNGCWKSSMSFYEWTLKHGGKNVRIYSNLGNQYAMKGNHEEAIKMFKMALETGTNLFGAYNNIGISYSNLNREEDAIEAYKKAIEESPTFAEAYNNLGVSCSNIGKKSEAAEAYRKAVEINPEYAAAYNNLGTVSSDPNEAIAAYRKAIEIDPNYANAYYNMGRAYAALGKTDEAEQAYNKFKSLKPELE